MEEITIKIKKAPKEIAIKHFPEFKNLIEYGYYFTVIEVDNKKLEKSYELITLPLTPLGELIKEFKKDRGLI